MEKISLIIPLRLTAGTFEGEARLRRICATVPRDLYEIVISDYGTDEAFAGPLCGLEAEGIRVVRHPSPAAIFSIGQSRDYGVQMARGRVVMFNDIDFSGTVEMYRQIHAEVERRDIATNLFDFFCVPVLFLTEEGTGRWRSRLSTGQLFLDAVTLESLERDDPGIQFTAFGSSAMVVNRHHYLSLGGHDTRFSGHGGEDYDLLHRLSALAPKGPRPNDYLRDYRDNGVRSYWGFRPFFALYGLDAFIRGLYLVHLWHPRRPEKGYFRPRSNFRHLRKLMAGFEKRGTMPLPLADLQAKDKWIVLVRNRRDLETVRQLLPLAREYEVVKCRAIPDARELANLAKRGRASAILICPEVGGTMSERQVEGADVFRFGKAAGEDRIQVSVAGRSEPARAGHFTIRSTRAVSLFRYWRQLDLGSLGSVDSGRIPSPEALDSVIFSSFGGASLLDRKLHPRPVPKKKSSLWVRFKRTLTGY
ncbi:hypothetical protein JJB09_02960 [Rhizobium sp. KVB221]|uniref:Glycosyltransferase 2-like prokaryotic type domain-containing protein n=1 Tax=Rhizobium setariae TaxID=2801340 RepID=A0A936YIX6_9HYPH|nr:galactosyltransferase-related protein [Rhizobium setariae]MBL0370978.1 hypothetical protein [Rhizobium setariae]